MTYYTVYHVHDMDLSVRGNGQGRGGYSSSSFSHLNLSSLVEKEDVNWLQILINLIWAARVPLLAWFVSRGPDRCDGVCRYFWGEESLLREGEDGRWMIGCKI